jgi:chromate transporter
VNTNREQSTEKGELTHVFEVARLFLRLGLTAFGGPAAHVALMQRECVDQRQWITRQQFLDLLAVSSLIPGPTSTELAMHIGRIRAGWAGLVAAGAGFILPSTVIVGLLAALYVRSGDLPVARGLLLTVQPVVVIMVLQAVVPLGRDALRSPVLVAIAAAAIVAALAGVPEIYVLLAAGALGAVRRPVRLVALAVAIGGAVLLAAEPVARAAPADVVVYFLRVGSLLFGSGYVLLPVLQGDLVDRLGWLSDRELLDAVAAGQATPGPLFTTATFIGYLVGGPSMALAATVAMFLPAFLFSTLSSVLLDRLRTSARARAFLDGVNAAAIALIALVVLTLGRVAFTEPLPIAIGVVAAVAILIARISPTRVLLVAALAGACYGLRG